ncbi:hypothetical protein D3C86_1513070 [compost metagenome]
MVSIIPGMENLAPERTETKSGFSGSPKRLPTFSSTVERAFFTPATRPSGSFSPASTYWLQTRVVMVKPGGTGRPARVISARFAPLPPKRSRMVASPSSKR